MPHEGSFWLPSVEALDFLWLLSHMMLRAAVLANDNMHVWYIHMTIWSELDLFPFWLTLEACSDFKNVVLQRLQWFLFSGNLGIDSLFSSMSKKALVINLLHTLQVCRAWIWSFKGRKLAHQNL